MTIILHRAHLCPERQILDIQPSWISSWIHFQRELSCSVVSDYWDPMNCSPPGSSVHRILQAWIMEWVEIPFLQGIFLIRGLSPHLLLGRWILYHWATGEALFNTCFISPSSNAAMTIFCWMLKTDVTAADNFTQKNDPKVSDIWQSG